MSSSSQKADLKLVNSYPGPVIIVDLEGSLIHLNPAARSFLSLQDLSEHGFSKLLPPNYIEINLNCQAAEVTIPATRMEFSNAVILWTTFFSDDFSQVIYQGVNITRMHRNEIALLEAKEKAEEGEKLKAAFLDNMSHEIRTPLNSLLGFLNILSDELSHSLSEDQKFYFDLINQNGNRLERTMRELLDISHFSSGTYQGQQRSVDVGSLVKQIINERQADISDKGIKLALHFSENETFITTDDYCLTQAVTHLIDNAVKYTDAGQILVGVSNKAQQVEIRIEDTGSGMNDEMQRHIFVAFNQGTMGHTKQFQGIGLGLSLVRVYLDEIKATIDLDSEIGEGSRFKIWIPI